MVEITRKAYAAVDAKALAEVAAAFEHSSLVALQRAREGRFSETAMETVRLAVEEARGAIADRRAELAADLPMKGPALGPRPVRP